jgi:hypothetical protein
MTDTVQVLRKCRNIPAQGFQVRDHPGIRGGRTLHSLDLDFEQRQFLAQVIVNLSGKPPLFRFLRQ